MECGEFYDVTGICDCDIEFDVVAGIGTCGRVFSIFTFASESCLHVNLESVI